MDRDQRGASKSVQARVPLFQQDDFFVRGDLKDAVGRGVDNRRAGAQVLLAELPDDLGPRGRIVA